MASIVESHMHPSHCVEFLLEREAGEGDGEGAKERESNVTCHPTPPVTHTPHTLHTMHNTRSGKIRTVIPEGRRGEREGGWEGEGGGARTDGGGEKLIN
jgi:hypothetical protein